MSEPLQEVLPKAGLVYPEKGNLSEVLCKPKILPIKSVSLQKLEEMEKKAKELGQEGLDSEQPTMEAIEKNMREGMKMGEESVREKHEPNIMTFE